MDKFEEARSLLRKYDNCCTAVLAAYSPDFGLEKDLAVRMAQGMPGIGLTGSVCGAVSGAALVIGLSISPKGENSDREELHRACETVRRFVTAFEQRHESIVCRKLIGRDISTWDKYRAAQKENAFSNCPQFVHSSIEILSELSIGEHTKRNMSE